MRFNGRSCGINVQDIYINAKMMIEKSLPQRIEIFGCTVYVFIWL